MASQKTGEQIGRQQKRWFIGGVVGGLVLDLVLMVVLLQIRPIRDFYGNSPNLSRIVFGVGMLVCVGIGIMVTSTISSRITTAEVADHPTPAALWAKAHGWSYSLEDNGLDHDLESSVPLPYGVVETYDMVGGMFEGRQTWAFTAKDYTGKNRGNTQTRFDSAIVMRLQRPWPGSLELGSFVSATDPGVVQFGPYRVAAQVREGETSRPLSPLEINGLLGETGFVPRLIQEGVPHLFGVWDKNGAHVATMVDWPADPEHVLGVVLPDLAQLAAILEWDAARRVGSGGPAADAAASADVAQSAPRQPSSPGQPLAPGQLPAPGQSLAPGQPAQE